MTEKDPEDMTASELLSALGGKSFVDTTTSEDMESIRALADKIDAEIEAAHRVVPYGSFMSNIDALISVCDYPPRRGDESFFEWVNRCWLPVPRYEDTGEPVDESDFGEGACLMVFDNGDWKIGNRGGGVVEMGSRRMRVKRPVPEVLGADGKPIVEGETVWLADEYARYAGKGIIVSGGLCGLAGVCADDALAIKRIVSDGRAHLDTASCAWCPASWLTHTPPDTQERIDEDAVKGFCTYWDCFNKSCDECPALVDGEKPWKRYGVGGCGTAKMLDLLRRQRELDKRMGGAK